MKTAYHFLLLLFFLSSCRSAVEKSDNPKAVANPVETVATLNKDFVPSDNTVVSPVEAITPPEYRMETINDSLDFYFAKRRNDLIDTLLNSRQIVQLDSSHRYKALKFYVFRRNVEGAKRIIDLGVDVNSPIIMDNYNYNQPLGFLAIRYPDFDMVKLLVENGLDLNVRTSQEAGDCVICPENITLLHSIVMQIIYQANMENYDHEKDYEILKYLFEKSEDPNPLNQYGDTPLFFAAKSERMDLVDTLMKYGAKVNMKDQSALCASVMFSDYEMSKKFLDHGADPNLGNPLIICNQCCGDGFGEGIIFAERVKTLQLLLDHGADPNLKNRDGNSFLDLCRKEVKPLLKL